ncbi:MAG: M81 family peptidase [Deltaproteobacteria bacterium]|nr:MAG: M81 family peptidase [Deltaproteobacteria bacterium]
MKKLRIAYARVAQETNAFSPVHTELADFHRTHWLEADALHRATDRFGYEARGFIRNAELSGFRRAVRQHGAGRVEAIPLFSAWAIPGGPLSRACFDALRDRLVADLRAAGPLDGVMLSLHGAMGAEDTVDPDGDLLRAVREAVGPDVKIAVSLDLHAQITEQTEAYADVISAYRTNPHRDHVSTGFRAGKMLIDALLGRTRPTVAWRTLPMVMGGGLTLDFLQPMRGVFRMMRRFDKLPGVLDSSLFMCHIWNDHPNLGWSVHVVTDGDQALADRLADDLAEAAWGVRHHGLPTPPSASEAIAKVRAATGRRRIGTACVCDVSDVVGAGAPGENPRLIQALLDEASDLLSFAPIRDAEVVEALWDRPIDSLVSTDVGGKLQPELNAPLHVSGRLARKVTLEGFDRVVLLDLGHVQLAVTEGAPLVMKPAFYRALGLNPWKADICVVKSLFPFRLYFLAENRLTIYAKTEGVTDFDLVRRFEMAHPVFPMAELDDWRPVDRIRRHVA